MTAAAQDEGSGAVPSGSSGAVVKPAKDDPKTAKKPQLVPPKLLKFASAPYPEEAQEKGIQADVILELTIDQEGKVTEAKSVEPVGNGFDEAAEAAALKFVFEPATKDGKPIPAKNLAAHAGRDPSLMLCVSVDCMIEPLRVTQ